MAVFHWKGTDGSEDREGDIEAANQDDAAAQLQNMGIIPTDIILLGGEEEFVPAPVAATPAARGKEAQNKDKFAGPEVNFRPAKVTNKELIVFTKKLATMVDAGLPIMKTLIMLRDQAETPNFQKVVNNIYKSVEAGSTLSESFMKFPTVFDTVYVNLLRAGETSGKLTVFLHKLVVQIEKAQKIKKKVKGALMYPIILLCVAGAVIGLMMVKVVPVFANMFGSMGGSLPAPTQLIVDISDFLRDPMKGGILVGTIVFAIVSFKYTLKKNVNVRRKFDKIMLKAPVLGDIIQRSTLAKIAMIEGNLSAAGVSVLDALDIVSRSMTSEPYKDSFADVKKGVAEGKTLSALYASFENLYPPTFAQMIAVGEETGNVDGMFEATAMYYEEEFDMAVDRLTEMLEPIMIIFMGITVGFIIVAMYMPIFQMGSMVSGNS